MSAATQPNRQRLITLEEYKAKRNPSPTDIAVYKSALEVLQAMGWVDENLVIIGPIPPRQG
jgi:hypothetical protein